MRRLIECSLVVALLATSLVAQEQASSDGDRTLAEYFRLETAKLSDTCLADIGTLEDWQARRSELRGQLLNMLGLDPLPERTELKPTVTARTEHDEFVVERLHFLSRPGLYVTGNLYLPKQPTEGGQKWPAILYLCGHGGVKKDGVSYGNKVHYQHHGGWFARHGFACLTIDSLQLGEIEAIHHGTYRYHMWWWLNRGYTPAGVEAWNCVRALDYLQSRDDIDADRIGVTGRSGGGAYSWWIAAIDDRVKAAVPVAGITDLQNHVVDGCVEGHCDCMYFVNTYRWDYPLVAALVAPRPLLISNSDRDSIFPLEGVIRTHAKVRRIYELYGAADKLALQITAGPHQDTQELRVHAFRWLNHHLKDDDSLVQKTAVPFFEPEQLQVFDGAEMPEDEQNTSIQETFVPAASPPGMPADDAAWAAMRDDWRRVLESKVFAGWPHEAEPLELAESFNRQSAKLKIAAYEFTSQTPFRLRLLLAHRPGLENAETVDLHIADESDWPAIDASMQRAAANGSEGGAAAAALPDFFAKIAEGNRAVAVIAPRGIGTTSWSGDEKKQIQIRRRFYLLGQTLDGMRVWDVRRAIQAVRQLQVAQSARVRVVARGTMATLATYASLFEPDVSELELEELPESHRNGPYFLNVDRYFGLPQALAMASERSRITISNQPHEAFRYATAVGEKLNWGAPETVRSKKETKTRNLILVTLDGLRWQELFGGAEARLLDKDSGGVRDVEQTRRQFWSDDPQERRKNLMPFFWRTIARQGQVLGDPRQESAIRCTNGRYFSYPGYSELLCGYGDPEIDSNNKRPNKNVTVLEWLNRQPGFESRVAAFASWDVFPFILNQQRSGIHVDAGWQALRASENVGNSSEVADELPRVWPGVRYDVFTFRRAVEYLQQRRPRVLYVALGETDDWAHEGRYDLYLDAARRNDRYLEELWNVAQTLPEYKDQTTLIVTSDHGRGDGREGWKSHGTEFPGSDRTWVAILGPETASLGLRSGFQGTQSQVAATVADALGLNFQETDERIAPPFSLVEQAVR